MEESPLASSSRIRLPFLNRLAVGITGTSNMYGLPGSSGSTLVCAYQGAYSVDNCVLRSRCDVFIQPLLTTRKRGCTFPCSAAACGNCSDSFTMKSVSVLLEAACRTSLIGPTTSRSASSGAEVNVRIRATVSGPCGPNVTTPARQPGSG